MTVPSRCARCLKLAPRRLLPVLMLLSVGCGSIFSSKSEYEQLKEKEQADADVFVDAGGKAVKEGYSMGGFSGSGWKVDMTGATIGEDVIEKLIELKGNQDDVIVLDFKKSSITDDQLAQLDDAKVLQTVYLLDLSDTAVTDAGLDKIKDVHVLSKLNLKGSKATAAGAKRLGDRKIAHKQTPRPFKKQPQTDL